jgi:xanthine dehydrogenase/oxidase
MPEYRMSLAASFLFRFWCDISNRLGVHLASEDISGIEEIRRGPSCGVQTYVNVQLVFQSLWQNSIVYLIIDNYRNLESVGKPMAHVSAMKQVTGEAVYTDDIPSIQGEAYAAFVRSTKAHAKLISVDATEALVQEGVYAFYTADDIRGTKNLLPAMGDEMLFAVDKVKYVGDSIGVIVAENQAVAQRAARMVKVEYEELPPIITIEVSK